MLKDMDAFKDLKIDFELTAPQRAILSGSVGQEWFDIVQRLFEDEARKFYLLLANTPVWEEEKVFARHCLAQAAGMIYKGVYERIAAEVGTQHIADQGIGTIYNPEKPPLMEEFDSTPLPDPIDTL